MKQKFLAYFICFALMVTSFAGCTKNNDDSSTTSGTDESVSQAKKEFSKPYEVFDFSNWKLQLPSESTTGGSVKEVYPDEIKAGYSDEYFYVKDDCVVFDCPVEGYKTGNTTYCRSELREMLDPSDKTANWTLHGTHILDTVQSVTRVPSSGKVITSQIHGIEKNGDNANPLVKVAYDYTKKSVYVMFKQEKDSASDTNCYFNGVELGQKFSTQIKVVEGSLYVTIASDGRSETFAHEFYSIDKTWDDINFYFKLGNYVLDSEENYEGEGATVNVYSNTLLHKDTIDPVPVEKLDISQGAEASMRLGERMKLNPVFTPIDAVNKNVIWSNVTSNGNAYVDNNGYVTAWNIGKETICGVSAENPDIKVECTINVNNDPVPDPVAIYEEDFGLDKPNDVFNSSNQNCFNFSGEYGTAEVVTDSSDPDNYVLKLQDISTDNNAGVKFIFDTQSDTTTISYKIRYDEITDGNNGYVYVQTENNSDADSRFDDATALSRVSNNNKNTSDADNLAGIRRLTLTNNYNSPEDADVNKKTEFTIGQWKEVTMITTPDNGTANANKTDYYIDGYLAGSSYDNKSVQDAVNKLVFFSGKGDLVTISIDDVKVYSGACIPVPDEEILPKTFVSTPLPDTMPLGNSLKVDVTITPIGASTLLKFVKVSGDDCLVYSNDGYLTAVNAGTTTFKLESAVDSDMYIEKTITVKPSEEMTRVSDITLDSDKTVVEIENTYQIDTQISPDNATEKGLSYKIISGDTFISVDNNGLVTAKEAGSAVIKVSSLDNQDIYKYITICVINHRENGEIIYKDSFSSSNLNSSWSQGSSNLNDTVTEIRDGCLYLEDNNKAGMQKVINTFAPLSGTFSIQYKIKIDSNGDDSNIRIAFGSGSITSVANEAFCLRTDEQGNFIYSHPSIDSKYITIPNGTFNTGEWYTLTFVTTIDSANTDNNATDIYIGDKKVVEGAGHKAKYQTIDKIMFSSGSKDTPIYSIDDFIIWVGDYSNMPSEDDSSEQTLIFSEDFENITSVSDKNTEIGTSGIINNTADASIADLNGSKVLKISDTNATDTSKLGITLDKAYSGDITFKYDVYVVGSANGSTTFSVGNTTAGGTTTSSSYEFFRVKTVSSGKFEYRGGNSTSEKSGSYSEATWISMTVIIHTDSQTFDVYADDVLLKEGMEMSCKTENVDMSSIDNFAFITGSKDIVDYYIDNIKVYN